MVKVKLPSALLVALENAPGFEREAFMDVHSKEEQVVSIRVNPAKVALKNAQRLNDSSIENARRKQSEETSCHSAALLDTELPKLNIEAPVPWSQYGYYLKQRPSFTFDPLFHAGCYYVQEASSMFVEQALQQLVDVSANIRVLDVSAAPGGKSTHIASLISEQSLLVCNEVIRSRSHVLTDNIIKWGLPNVMVTNNDPAAFKGLTSFFDVIVVDAPCSGSGLFRKDADAMNEWSLNNVALCSERQQRILANVIPALKPGGILIYSTCSYSVEEDEAICDWLMDSFDVSSERLTIPKAWGIVESESAEHRAHGYRFYPDQVMGEGLFLACFKKHDGPRSIKLRPAKASIVSHSEALVLQAWIDDDKRVFIKEDHEIAAVPSSIVEDYLALKPVLHVQYSGTIVGALMKGHKLVPHHSLALSTCLSDNVANLELTYEDSIRYLQRQDLKLTPSVTGWQTVSYLQHRLGWINALPNRINNYYPKEMRILKQTDPAVADTEQTKEGQEP